MKTEVKNSCIRELSKNISFISSSLNLLKSDPTFSINNFLFNLKEDFGL